VHQCTKIWKSPIHLKSGSPLKSFYFLNQLCDWLQNENKMFNETSMEVSMGLWTFECCMEFLVLVTSSQLFKYYLDLTTSLPWRQCNPISLLNTQNLHLFKLRLTPMSLNLLKWRHNFERCIAMLLKTLKSSKTTSWKFHYNP
jgi:hypothetical protein